MEIVVVMIRQVLDLDVCYQKLLRLGNSNIVVYRENRPGRLGIHTVDVRELQGSCHRNAVLLELCHQYLVVNGILCDREPC